MDTGVIGGHGVNVQPLVGLERGSALEVATTQHQPETELIALTTEVLATISATATWAPALLRRRVVKSLPLPLLLHHIPNSLISISVDYMTLKLSKALPMERMWRKDRFGVSGVLGQLARCHVEEVSGTEVENAWRTTWQGVVTLPAKKKAPATLSLAHSLVQQRNKLDPKSTVI